MALDFDILWGFVIKRSKEFPVVQERNELEHVFNLIKDCESYLEIGTAEGNSVYVLAHALKPGATITCVDLGEMHTKPCQEEVCKLLAPTWHIGMFHGDSTNAATYPRKREHDVVMIDGGHDYHTVLSDCQMYAPLAKKYVLFHDVKLPDVAKAIGKYINDNNPGTWKYREFVNSPTMGYGILEKL